MSKIIYQKYSNIFQRVVSSFVISSLNSETGSMPILQDAQASQNDPTSIHAPTYPMQNSDMIYLFDARHLRGIAAVMKDRSCCLGSLIASVLIGTLPIITLKAIAADEQRQTPSQNRQTSKYTPGQCLTLGANVDG